MKIEKLTQKEISEFLNRISPNSKCPFCGGAMLVSEFPDYFTLEPPLHDTTKIEIKENNDGETEFFFKKKQRSAPTVRYLCHDCGYTLMFDYFTLVRKIKGESNANH